MLERVVFTPEARRTLRQLKAAHGALIFHISGGCCEGSAPMCFRQSDFRAGAQDVLLGMIEGCPFYVGRPQSAYWAHSQLILDITTGGGDSFPWKPPKEYVSSSARGCLPMPNSRRYRPSVPWDQFKAVISRDALQVGGMRVATSASECSRDLLKRLLGGRISDAVSCRSASDILHHLRREGLERDRFRTDHLSAKRKASFCEQKEVFWSFGPCWFRRRRLRGAKIFCAAFFKKAAASPFPAKPIML